MQVLLLGSVMAEGPAACPDTVAGFDPVIGMAMQGRGRAGDRRVDSDDDVMGRKPARNLHRIIAGLDPATSKTAPDSDRPGDVGVRPGHHEREAV